MRVTTIDNLDLKTHERYAQDQKILDRTFVTDSSLLSPHAEIAATSVIYASKWEELFATGVKNLPWAAFSSPSLYRRKPNRFFSFRVLPTIDIGEEEEEPTLLKKARDIKQRENQDASLFERDKGYIVSLLSCVSELNKMLGQINARKLQYQKG